MRGSPTDRGSNPARPPADTLEARFAAFRAAHPPRSIVVDGRRWSYLAGGGEGPALLVLGGALGKADFGFLAIEHLESDFRIIAPDYPPVNGLDDLSNGLAGILDAEGVRRCHVVGGSFGGVVAQAFARRHENRVASLALSHTGAPRRAFGARAALGIAERLPLSWLRGLFRRRVRSALAGADPFWLRQFEESVQRLTRADLVGRMRAAAELGDRYAQARPERSPWPVLILDSSSDPLVGVSDRQALRDLYPEAEIVDFEGTGHIASILEPKAFADVLSAFFTRAAGEAKGPDQSSG